MEKYEQLFRRATFIAKTIDRDLYRMYKEHLNVTRNWDFGEAEYRKYYPTTIGKAEVFVNEYSEVLRGTALDPASSRPPKKSRRKGLRGTRIL